MQIVAEECEEMTRAVDIVGDEHGRLVAFPQHISVTHRVMVHCSLLPSRGASVCRIPIVDSKIVKEGATLATLVNHRGCDMLVNVI